MVVSRDPCRSLLMPRLRTAVLCGLVPATATAADPATLPGTVVPSPATAVPNVSVGPSAIATGVPVTGTPAGPRGGALRAVMSWWNGDADVVVPPPVPVMTNWQSTTPTYPAAPPPAAAAPCPTPAPCAAPAPAACTTCRHGSGMGWDRLKGWFCWKPSHEQGLPILVPNHYHAPARAYFHGCHEPHTTAAACNTCGTLACGPTGCPAPAVAVKATEGTRAEAKPVAVKATKPVPAPVGGTELAPGMRFASPHGKPVAPQPQVYQPVQPTAGVMSRPFTNP